MGERQSRSTSKRYKTLLAYARLERERIEAIDAELRELPEKMYDAYISNNRDQMTELQNQRDALLTALDGAQIKISKAEIAIAEYNLEDATLRGSGIPEATEARNTKQEIIDRKIERAMQRMGL